MSIDSSGSAASHYDDYAAYGGGYGEAFEFSPGERIGAPFRRKKIWLRGLALAAISAGTGWAYLNGAFAVPAWWDDLSWYVSRPGNATPEAQQPKADPAPPPPIEPARDVTAAPAPPPAAAENAALAKASAADEMSATPAKSEPGVSAQALPAPPPAQLTAAQKRAEATGLHPDLSRAVLERMTDSDFKNAAVAIKTALAGMPDGDVFTWPKKKISGAALFEVKFVEGANADCRRYVVTVTLDRWSATALPMEKCGIKRTALKGGR